MTGLQFGQAMQAFMKEHGEQYEQEAIRQGINHQVKDIHKIAANPEKSKHLETITTRMFGMDVDFVNLRKEVYDEESRNPQMEFGTAEEDAMRRDATVNALFYNLDTQAVEDFTQRGLQDMENKIIRTPLAPYQTFKDDPLRVLRLIRFASRLGYEIEAEAQQAMQDKTIHEALRHKISRERVGVEVMKVMAGPDPHTGLKYINDFDIYATVFADPADKECPEARIALLAYDGLQKILEVKSSICLGLKPKQDQALSWFLAAYVPWLENSANANNAAWEGIKATNSMRKVLKEAIDYRPGIVKAIDLVVDGKATRADVGMILRQCKDAWRSHVLYSLLCDIAEADFTSATDRYQTFITFVYDQQLEDAHTIAPLLKGDKIKGALGEPKGGPWLKKAVDLLAEWQFNHPDATKEQAIEMLSGKKAEIGLG
ncbi:CCA tRNA nucleotidyltransferase, mitochondrial [Elasticomyces elasticus]|uniref:CCA tRNA nucleotidyltransferase, mitochondrial n=1 Tax=Exophiala sideris TaxID=1016849 RepID=A0ABR0J0B4_9EURO|nr:CCA tRNA nucleotidyltransferase, mitochondrial [Elasticomyces elasticus]KAK5023181.1 CCA tRNA nucleotidyltransferase, mitochondrial [Exophiala sideris]KAK5028553.1 CCA tRNA nucleotidyltransferase, mitochondrial [Exophiala sideris]KAK5052931.1 CCA tRNA nucleotidyltransferase, mitochondrial [Exophiala sideris]KAK5178671.1 CCA tRNA nucleotidyltransferase, mitochondrial [Eurotiomycetes sp. CCFEE 6388]